MKKIWKNLCVCSMALACGVGLVGCGNSGVPTSVDLDGDGKVSTWETLFSDASSSVSSGETITITKTVSSIKTASDLLAINDAVKSDPNDAKAYILEKDIDMGGAEVCINLGKSELYGNGHVISNFKLGTYYAEDYVRQEEGATPLERTPSGTKCLFYGGGIVYGVNLFMKVQDISLDNKDIESWNVSPFVNTSYIDHVSVRGKMNVHVPNMDDRNSFNLDASLLYSQKQVVESVDDVETLTDHVTNIRNISVAGVVMLNDNEEFLQSNIGGVASTLGEKSVIYNANVELDLSANNGHIMNYGGIVGYNKGFVSTCSVAGSVKTCLNTVAQGQNVGSIAGMNGSCAEIKNCKTTASIDFEYVGILASYNRNAVFNYGGIVGYNAGGILEYVQSDSAISATNVSNIYVGGISGRSDRGIISYALCRGSITLKDVYTIFASQVSGYASHGLMEKILTTTSINVDNSQTVSEVNVGMVTIFENVAHMSDDYTAGNSPYFKSILVDGITEVFMKQGDTFRYALGLRNSYKAKTGEVEDQEEGTIEPVYTSKLPDIFSDLYYTTAGGFSTTGCQLYKYELINGEKSQNHPTVTYARDDSNNKKINESSNTTNWMIDSLDFKNYLNHNEVNLSDKIVFSELNFTLDKSVQERSYFGESKYNGELAYFDREFTQSYTHEDSAVGSCENDSKDEFVSFIYDLMCNSQDVSSYVIKVSDEFLDVDWDNPDESNIKNFRSILENAFVCLNTMVEVTTLNVDKVDVSTDGLEDLSVKYIRATFEDDGNYYIMLIDVESLETGVDGEAVSKGDYSSYMLYLTFSVISKSGLSA